MARSWLGRRASLARDGGNVTSYTYDGASRLYTLAHDLDGSGTASDVTFSFGYNPDDQATQRTISNDAYAYALPANDSVAYVGNGLNQYSSVDGVTFAYDANGNLTDDGPTTFGSAFRTC